MRTWPRPASGMGFLTISPTSALLSHDSANSPSVCLVVSHSSRLVNVLKKASARSITYASLLMIMQAALSSVNFGLNSKPSLEKNSIDFFKSRTARLTKSFRERSAAMVLSLGWIFNSRLGPEGRREPLVAQPETSPEERRDVHGKVHGAAVQGSRLGRPRPTKIIGRCKKKSAEPAAAATPGGVEATRRGGRASRCRGTSSTRRCAHLTARAR